MLENFEPDDISLNIYAKDRVDAINKASELLIKKGSITYDYVDEIIEAMDKYGPYFVLAPGMAFAHSKPSSSVLHTGLSMVTLEEPVEFFHELNDPVFLVCVIASVNTEDHLKLLTKLTKFLANSANVQLLKQSMDLKDKKWILQQLNRTGE